MDIILGSSSPRRKEILSYLRLPFKVVPSLFDEDSIPFEGCAASYAKSLSYHKALTLKPSHSQDIILTADTIVHLRGKLFQKPKDLKEAHEFLRALSGQTHEVYTGMCVMTPLSYFVEDELTLVTFNSLTDAQIDAYLKTVSTLDKSGGYTIQGLGSLIVRKIDGCYYNVLGLPLQKVAKLLFLAGIDVWDYV